MGAARRNDENNLQWNSQGIRGVPAGTPVYWAGGLNFGKFAAPRWFHPSRRFLKADSAARERGSGGAS
jgi:hypothetical protein